MTTKTPFKEGSLAAPIRHPLAWQEEMFYDEAALDTELRRVFDICHGCRRCFNLCDSFPRLFDAIDDSESGELDTVDSSDFAPVADACTLCDMCFLTKCPYVPPHEFNLDFPHLMLRYRAVEHKKGKTKIIAKEITKTDRNGAIGCGCSSLANWASSTNNSLTRGLLEKVAGIDKEAYLPPYASKRLSKSVPTPTQPEAGVMRKVVLYATCFAEYNNTAIGKAAIDVLARNKVHVQIVYPECCGMPQLEHGDIATVVDKAIRVATHMETWIDKGYEVVSLTPSCSFMLKFEWPLLLPQDSPELPRVRKLAAATKDISEYLVGIANNEGLVPGMAPLEGGVTLHIACHSRAQNIGQKATELMQQVPETAIAVIERCSGHGGSWGIMKDNFDTALKVGKPASRNAAKQANRYMVSECALAREHLVQGMHKIKPAHTPNNFQHPVELIAHAYSLGEAGASTDDSTKDSTQNQ